MCSQPPQRQWVVCDNEQNDNRIPTVDISVMCYNVLCRSGKWGFIRELCRAWHYEWQFHRSSLLLSCSRTVELPLLVSCFLLNRMYRYYSLCNCSFNSTNDYYIYYMRKFECSRHKLKPSFNVSFRKYATKLQYAYCPSWALDWEYRRKGIIDEMFTYR